MISASRGTGNACRAISSSRHAPLGMSNDHNCEYQMLAMLRQYRMMEEYKYIHLMGVLLEAKFLVTETHCCQTGKEYIYVLDQKQLFFICTGSKFPLCENYV
jgi:hypothetical protein